MVRDETLEQWSSRSGFKIENTVATEHTPAAMYVIIDNPNDPFKPDLFSLKDVVVSSVCGIVYWLVRRHRQADTAG